MHSLFLEVKWQTICRRTGRKDLVDGCLIKYLATFVLEIVEELLYVRDSCLSQLEGSGLLKGVV